MKVERLSWDSEFFGLRIGHAFVGSIEDSCTLASQKDRLKADYDLVYVFSNQGVEFSCEGAKLVDQKMVYTLSDYSDLKVDENVIIWDCDKLVTDALLHLALVSGKYSRFKLDNRFPSGGYERLYSRWIEQSVNHAMATEVFCYMVGDTPKGLVTLDLNEGEGTIGLVAIAEDYQHRGVGTAMMRHVISYVQKHQCKKLSVATQYDNTPACRLYEKVGFRVESMTNVWHWWL
ncbi:MAG: GNAT family N-acetyltransferase [Bacteroidales bacterium]|nr:GNAT family N-acetyltransferase [Bacteroidales bacterium]